MIVSFLNAAHGGYKAHNGSSESRGEIKDAQKCDRKYNQSNFEILFLNPVNSLENPVCLHKRNNAKSAEIQCLE